MCGELIEKIRNHVTELRTIYINSTIRQRHAVAAERIRHIDSQVLQLCNIVSAVEGFARALLLEWKRRNGDQLQVAYESIKRYTPSMLVEEYLKSEHAKEAKTFFKEDWEYFLLAQEARNLIIHESTYLRQDFTIPLKESCLNIFGKLEELSGVSVRD